MTGPGLGLALALAAALASLQAAPTGAPDAAPWQASFLPHPATFGISRRALYLPMPDGVRLAADVYLPTGGAPGARVPTLLVQTRYYRKTATKADPKGSCAAPHSLARYFTARGYALVIVDVRGTGASFGTRDSELGAQETKDGSAVLNWIAAQPWSTARVGAFGQSYLGSSAELLTLNHNPALKAIAPVSATYDPYADLYRPGGILNTTFQAGWGANNRALDAGKPDQGPPQLKAALGPCPVDGDEDETLLKQAITEHAGDFDSAAAAAHDIYRGDPTFGRGLPLPYDHVRDFDPIPVLSIEASQDSGYARSGIDRMLDSPSPRQRLILAAGDHGAHHFYAPGVIAPVPSAFDQNAEILAFMDRNVAGLDNGYDRQPRVRWFTTGANVWRSADAWPAPARTAHFHLAADGSLAASPEPPTHTVPRALVDTDDDNHGRWDTTVGSGAVFHADQAPADRMRLTFTSAPLSAPLELTGSALLTLKAIDVAPDGDWFVYLEEIDPQGRAWRVTDGQLRTSARGGAAPYAALAPLPSGFRADRAPPAPGRELTLRIALLPLSHRFSAGSRLRIAITGSDRAHFDDRPLASRRVSIATGRGGSTLTLPVAPP